MITDTSHSWRLNLKGLKMSVAEKVIIVTGAGSGIGKATALLLGAEKARVALFDINQSIFEVEDQIKSAGGTALAIKVDVSSAAEVDAATKAIVEAFGPVDGELTYQTYRCRTLLSAADRPTRRRRCQLGRCLWFGNNSSGAGDGRRVGSCDSDQFGRSQERLACPTSA